MPKFRRVLKRLEPTRSPAFDEQLWAVNSALFLLAAFTGALIYYMGGWTDPHILHNGWFRFATFGITLATLAWAINTPQPRRARRLQMCVLVSLIIHIGLAVVLQQYFLPMAEKEVEEASKKAVVEKKIPIFRPPEPPKLVQEEFEKPLTSEAKLTATDATSSRSDTQTKQEAATHSLQQPELSQVSPPAPQKMKRPEASRPRWSDSLAKLKHREKNPAQTASGASAPQSIAQEQQRKTALDAASSELARSNPQSVKQSKVEPLLETPSKPTLQAIAENESQPTITEAVPRIARNEPKAAQLPTTALAPVEHSTAKNDPLQENLQTQSFASKRSPTTLPQTSAEISPNSNAMESLVKRAKTSRIQESKKPNATQLAKVGKLPRRVATQSNVAIANSAAELSEVRSQATDGAMEQKAKLAPNAIAMSRGNSGFAGEANSPNPGHELPASKKNLASSASVASQRTKSSQKTDTPVLTSASNQRFSKTRRLASSPAVTAQASPVDSPNVSGSSQPGELAVSTGAAPQRQNSTANLGQVSSAIGGSSLDTGAERIVPSNGVGRAAGGGQPKLQTANTTMHRRSSASSGALAAGSMAQIPTELQTKLITSGDGPSNETEPLLAASSSSSASTVRSQTQSSSGNPGSFDSSFSTLNAHKKNGQLASGGLSQAAKGVASSASGRVSKSNPSLNAGTIAPGRRRKVAGLSGLSGLSASIPVSANIANGLSGMVNLASGVKNNSQTPGPGMLAIARQGAVSEVEISSESFDDGGLGEIAAASAGLPDRNAERRSEVVISSTSRFRRKQSSGQPTIRGAARIPAPAFAKRATRGEPMDSTSPNKPGEKTEAAIELGLKYLAKMQRPDGRWALEYNGADQKASPEERPSMRSDSAATGLALLAFLGAGYDHYEDQYRDHVGQGLLYLTKNQRSDGALFFDEKNSRASYTRFYSHGIATIALCEAYGMTGDKSLREPAQKAINYIVNTQHKKLGGWRYLEGKEADLSVTGWQVMALKSGELAGLEVPPETYERIKVFLKRCQAGTNNNYFIYNPAADANSAQQAHGRKPSTVMTSIGLLTHLYLGTDPKNPSLQNGAKHLMTQLPAYNPENKIGVTGTMKNPWRDTYYWYYATQVMFHMKGEYWVKWNEKLHPILVKNQTQAGPLAGSWNPYKGTPDRWAGQCGRLYVTTMNLLSLEVYYRHMPLYEVAGE